MNGKTGTNGTRSPEFNPHVWHVIDYCNITHLVEFPDLLITDSPWRWSGNHDAITKSEYPVWNTKKPPRPKSKNPEELQMLREELFNARANFARLHGHLSGNRLTISNSLQKFYHGNNAGLYTHSELIKSLDLISAACQTSPDLLKIRNGFEIGINIKTDHPPEAYYRLLLSGLNAQPFYSMPPRNSHPGQVHGVICRNSQFTLKAYSKTEDVKQTDGIKLIDHILRIELKVHRRDQVTPFIKSAADLQDLATFRKLLWLFIEKFETMTMKKEIPINEIKPLDRMKLMFANAGLFPEFLDTISNRNTRKKWRTQYNEVREILGGLPDLLWEELNDKTASTLGKIIKG